MQLNCANFINRNMPVSFGSMSFQGKISTPDTEDKFVKTGARSREFEKSFEYAKSACIERLKENVPFEYSVAIGNDGRILYEHPGEKMHCGVLYSKLEPGSTVVRGHPGESLKPLSPADVTTFLSTPEMQTITAVSKNGETCSMTKPEGFLNFRDKNMASDEINELFMKTWLDYVGISYELDDDYVKECEEEIKEKLGYTDEEIERDFYGMRKPENPKDAFESLRFQAMMRGINLKEPLQGKFIQNLRTGQDEAIEVEILKAFLEKVTEEYGTTVEYN